jgi:flagellar hook-associated protein 3 FlgL
MTITGNISFFAQATSQSNRLNDLRSLMDDLQRQATTQKKFESLSGFGTGTLNLLRLRNEQPLLQSYMDNIDQVSTRMTLMNTSLSKISEVANQMINTINLQRQNGQINVAAVQQQAQQSLKFVEDLINQNIDGHYLFGGSDMTNPPFVDDSTLNSNFQNQIAPWLAGTITNAQIKATTDGFSLTNLGLSAGLPAAGTVTARIDHNLDIDYTIKADQQGFQDVIRALAFAANLTYPDATTDVATPVQYNDLLDHILDMATDGVREVNDTSQQLASKFNLVKSIRENHASDLGVGQTQIDKIENADPTSVLTSMQVLQTQLTASYRITQTVSQLSLVNFL